METSHVKSSKGGTDISLQAMTEKEIKEWLKEKGYKVKKLGNRKFQVTRKYKPDNPEKQLSITSIFNANTGQMEPGYEVSKNGKIKSKHFDKKKESNGMMHHKSKIKRHSGSDKVKDEHLLLEITQTEN